MKTNFFLLLLLTTVNASATFAQSPAMLADNSTEVSYSLNVSSKAFYPDFGKYLGSHLLYPELARKNGVEGVVVAEVIIGPKGDVLSTELIAGIGFGCDEAALKMLATMPRWHAALQNGVPVFQKVRLNIRFQLK